LNLNSLIQKLKKMILRKNKSPYNYEIEEEKMVQQEDENFEKLIHVEIENNKLKNTHRKLRSELGSCEKKIEILKKQL
jgi:hypothetical protein